MATNVTLTEIGDRLPLIDMTDVDGKPVPLDDLLDTAVAVPLVRYYGCMPCRDFLHQLDAVRPQLEAVGVKPVGVFAAADYQARHLMDHGISYPLLLDPEHRLYEALQVRHIRWWKLLLPTTWWRYIKAARRARQGRITDHPLQAPGFVLIDRDRTVRFLHRGQTLGDYPTIAEVLDAARALQQNGT